MDEDEMADALAFELNQAPWIAEIEIWNVISFTNERGERFQLTVEKMDDDE